MDEHTRALWDGLAATQKKEVNDIFKNSVLPFGHIVRFYCSCDCDKDNTVKEIEKYLNRNKEG